MVSTGNRKNNFVTKQINRYILSVVIILSLLFLCCKNTKDLGAYDFLSEEDLIKAALDEEYVAKISVIPPLPPIAVAPHSIGDVNEDGKLELLDALLIIQYLMENKKYHFNKELANLNKDSFVSIDDAMQLVYQLKGITDSSSINLFLNPHFNSTKASWYFYTDDTGTGNWATVEEKAVIDISNPGTNPWDIGFGQADINIEANTIYTLSFKASATSPITINTLLLLNKAPWTRYAEKTFTIGKNKSEYKTDFMVYENNPSCLFQIMLGANKEEALIYLDDLVLKKKGKIEKKFTYQPPQKSQPSDFVRAHGRQLIVGAKDKVIHLRGVAFGNDVWNKTITRTHHDMRDFQKVKSMGGNTIRFYINYKILEDDSNPYVYKDMGWEWLDQNITWAKQQGLYLILNMHIPQGGFQSYGEGFALWNVQENQERLIALWKAIAERYKNESVIAGYDLVNEPLVSHSVTQWKELAQRLTNAIREKDSNHLIVVEELLGEGAFYSHLGEPEYTFVAVNDPQGNVMYDFHFYYPQQYTHQGFSYFRDEIQYPDANATIFPNDLVIANQDYSITGLTSGNSSWTYVEGEKIKVNDPAISVMAPGIIASGLADGSAWFDDFVINVYDAENNLVKSIPYDIEAKDYWFKMGRLAVAGSSYPSTEVHAGKNALRITGDNDDVPLLDINYRFIPVQGYSYSLAGWIKGEKIPAQANARFTILAGKSENGEAVSALNQQYLAQLIGAYVDFGIKNNVPLNVGEFGLVQQCFLNNHNGITWVNDVLTLLHKYELNYTYHDWHDPIFGIYYNPDGLPNSLAANKPLIQLLSKYFKNKK